MSLIRKILGLGKKVELCRTCHGRRNVVTRGLLGKKRVETCPACRGSGRA